MSVTVVYSTTARAVGGRTGEVRSLDGPFQARLSTPRELGGQGGEGTNPEQLFAAGYAACFLGAMKATGTGPDHPNVPVDAAVTAHVGIGPRDEGGFGISAELTISLPGIEREAAQRLVHAAHQVCPYSNATRGNVDVKLTLL